MQILILNSIDATISNNLYLSVEEIGGFYFVNFKNLPDIQPKIDFIQAQMSNINYNQQLKLSRMSHCINHRSAEFVKVIPVLDSDGKPTEINLNNFDLTYENYLLLKVFFKSDGSVKDIRKEIKHISGLPDKLVEQPNYFSFVLMHSLYQKFGGVNLEFYFSNNTLAMKAENTSEFYDISYRPPYNADNLI